MPITTDGSAAGTGGRGLRFPALAEGAYLEDMTTLLVVIGTVVVVAAIVAVIARNAIRRRRHPRTAAQKRAAALAAARAIRKNSRPTRDNVRHRGTPADDTASLILLQQSDRQLPDNHHQHGDFSGGHNGGDFSGGHHGGF